MGYARSVADDAERDAEVSTVGGSGADLHKVRAQGARSLLRALHPGAHGAGAPRAGGRGAGRARLVAMGEAARSALMTPQEYLAFERASEQRHEYADGETFAMSGGTREHSLIGQNIARELGNALLDRPCEVHGPDMRIKVVATGRYVYPDVSVVCGQPRFEDEHRDCLLNPVLIVEVLSDSTERYDRGDKFTNYRTVASLEHYVLASQSSQLVEHYQRQQDGTWVYRALGPGERLVLASLGCELEIDRAYLKVFGGPTSSAS